MTFIGALLLVWFAQGPPVDQSPTAAPAAAKSVAAVKALYSVAEYEEALKVLGTIETPLLTAEHEQYRALCFLALAQPEDAEASLERLVWLSPSFALAEAEVSPRILTMFRDVRRRVLPAIVRERYATGKRLFDERRFAQAIAVLEGVQVILSDPDVAYPADAFADLRQLADGFVRLAEIEVAEAEKARAAEAAPPPAPVAAPPPVSAANPSDVVVTKILVYSADDADVTPPVELERFMPPWVPASAMARARQQYRGELQVVVDEAGRIEQARMTRPTVPQYDLTLTTATRRWRFEPARRQGVAVKYLLTFQIVLSSSPEAR